MSANDRRSAAAQVDRNRPIDLAHGIVLKPMDGDPKHSSAVIPRPSGEIEGMHCDGEVRVGVIHDSKGRSVSSRELAGNCAYRLSGPG